MEFLEGKWEFRKLKKKDVDYCVNMIINSFGYNEYQKDSFKTLKYELELSFSNELLYCPKYYVLTVNNTIVAIGGILFKFLRLGML